METESAKAKRLLEEKKAKEAAEREAAAKRAKQAERDSLRNN